jgi:hypothetical protein
LRIKLAMVLILILAVATARFVGGPETARAAGFGGYLNFSYNATTQTATWQFQYTSQDPVPTVQQFNTLDTAATAISATPATCTTTFPTKDPAVCTVPAGGVLTLTYTEPIPLTCGAPASVPLIGGFNVVTQSIPLGVQGSAVGFILVVPSTTSTNVGGVLVPNNVPAGPACPAGPVATPSPTATPIFVTGYQPTPVIPVFQNPAAGGLFNPIAKSPTPRPVAAVAPQAAPEPGSCVVPIGQGVAGICLRPPNTGDAGLKSLQEGSDE